MINYGMIYRAMDFIIDRMICPSYYLYKKSGFFYEKIFGSILLLNWGIYEVIFAYISSSHIITIPFFHKKV